MEPTSLVIDTSIPDIDSSKSHSKVSDGTYVQVMRSFVPDTLTAEIYDNILSKRHMEPHSRVFRGVVVIVDISGFTKLSGYFCSQGKDGIDGLQKIVNGYMGLLVQEVYDCGGDVIKFAGDALICIFEPVAGSGEEGLLSPCIRSLLCAWKLKDVCTPELTAHIGIALGDICFGVMGGHNARWEFLVSGSCISELSQCLDDAPSRNVAVTETFHKVLSTLLDSNPSEAEQFTFAGDSLASSNFRVTACDHQSPPQNANALRALKISYDSGYEELKTHMFPFVPQAVIQALNADTFNFLAELREVTTVFIKWDGYSNSEHNDLLSLQKPFYAAQEIINHAGGFLRQFLVDDKGCVLIAMWGVPGAAFPDNAVRALWATVTMCQKLGALHMPLSCGMTTGNVFCGNVGSPLRQEYAAVGDVVNLAARLMSKAKHSIYIDEASYSRLPEAVQGKLTGLPEVKVKGKDAPIKPYQYHDLDDSFDFRDIAFNEEQYPIRQACKDVFIPLLSYLQPHSTENKAKASYLFYDHSSPQSLLTRFVVIEGPAGTGRGRALSWFKHNAEERGTRVVHIAMSKLDGHIDYSMLAKMFRCYIREENFDDDGRQFIEVNQFLDEIYPQDRETKEKVAFPCMTQVLGVTCELRMPKGKANAKRNKPKRVPTRLIFQSLFDIFSGLLKKQPLLITVENSQHIDQQSWELLHAFADVPARAVVVLAMLPANIGSKTNTTVSSRGGADYSDSGATTITQTLERNFVKMINNRFTYHVVLKQYTFSEMRVYLAHCLKTRPNSLPKGLDVIVFQLSGANPLWVSEICDFIRTHSVQEFMKTMTGHDIEEKETDESTKRRASRFGNHAVKHLSKQISLHFDMSFMTAHKSDRPDSNVTVTLTSDNAPAPTPMTGRGSLVSVPEHSERIGPGTSESEKISGNKLSFLIVCRFAKLGNEAQTVARSASIVGSDFTEDILRSVTPHILHHKLPSILDVLVKSNWVVASDEKSRKGTSYVLYSFIHTLVYESIYELTPKGLRQAVHLSIAQFLEAHEKLFSDRVDYHPSLAFHYGKCDGMSAKEFEYMCKSALETVNALRSDLDVAVKYIDSATSKGTTSVDMSTLIGIVCKAREKYNQNEAKRKRDLIESRSRFVPVFIQERWAALPVIKIPFIRSRILPAFDSDSQDLTLTLKVLESEIVQKERELFEAEVESGNPPPQPAPWQRGLIFLRRKKSILSNNMSKKIGMSFSLKGARSVYSMSRKAPSESSQSLRTKAKIKEREVGGNQVAAEPSSRSIDELQFLASDFDDMAIQDMGPTPVQRCSFNCVSGMMQGRRVGRYAQSR